MAVYMQGARSRRSAMTMAVIALIVGLVVGGVVGYLVGDSGSKTTTDIVRAAQSKGEAAAESLDRLPIEYEQAVTNSSGESKQTIDDAIDDTASLLEEAYVAAPWITSGTRQQLATALEALHHDVATDATTSAFQSDITTASTSIRAAFGSTP